MNSSQNICLELKQKLIQIFYLFIAISYAEKKVQKQFYSEISSNFHK